MQGNGLLPSDSLTVPAPAVAMLEPAPSSHQLQPGELVSLEQAALEVHMLKTRVELLERCVDGLVNATANMLSRWPREHQSERLGGPWGKR